MDYDELKTSEELGKGFMLQRYKGLGEMNPERLWETTMNPETGTLIRVQIEDEMRSSKRVTTLMGDKAPSSNGLKVTLNLACKKIIRVY